jgi:apolipoprotein D and lipocalin family protein
MNKFLLSMLIGFTVMNSNHAGAASSESLQVVQGFDVSRYLGKWYEIASFPQSFQKGCEATTATYSLRDNGTIKVLNECHLGAIDGPLKSATGTAWQTSESEPAKLRVQFFWPFSGKYWVIDLGKEYEYAVVGHPNRKYLWILSRTPVISEEVYQQITTRVEAMGFNLDRLRRTAQPNN